MHPSYTLYPIPYTLYLIPYTLYPILYLIPYTLYLIPYTLYPIPYTSPPTATIPNASTPHYRKLVSSRALGCSGGLQEECGSRRKALQVRHDCFVQVHGGADARYCDTKERHRQLHLRPA
jgi:hypothetical protein